MSKNTLHISAANFSLIELENTNSSPCSTSRLSLIKVASWSCSKPIAVVHILHGMGEHKYRYHEFASFLTLNNIHVYAHDHLGHGDSIDNDYSPAGHFDDESGYQKIVANVDCVQRYIGEQHADLPVFILGHSMGSFVAQSYLSQYQTSIDSKLAGVILTGSALTPRPLLKGLNLIAQLETLRLGKKGQSKLLNFLSFGSFNKSFKPNRTEFDWLSRDDNTVDAYIDDDYCGFVCSCSSWQQLSKGLLEISQAKCLTKINTNISLLIISGTKDPVGAYSKYVNALKSLWNRAGHDSVHLHLINNARHEVLNEIDKENTYNIILNWIGDIS